jgi:hypothetical protein
MSPHKISFQKDIFKRFCSALESQYQRILQVIDDALNSDNFKERSWAVELWIKRLAMPDAEPTDATTARRKKKNKLPSPQELEALSDAELLTRIQDHLKDWAGE